MKPNHGIKRLLEIIPGACSWGILALLVALSISRPIACAVCIIVFDFYWIIRTCYLTLLLLLAHRRLSQEKYRNWLHECQTLVSGKGCHDVYQLVIFPVYKEGVEILRPSLEALKNCYFPKERMIVVVAFEERNPQARAMAGMLEAEYGQRFFGYLSTFHPDGLPGEARTKGANATWAARKAREFLAGHNIPLEDTIISCFDADTCIDPEYFGCLTYHFLTSKKPHQASYQPMPVYNNNVWYAPTFARIVEISSSFTQLIDSMRLEKFVTFSSHSMSFKTLVEIDYWPVDMISDDSVVYWKAFIHYNGDYRVVPLYITVSMDAAYADTFLKTLAVQYRQKRRWAWGVENFPWVMRAFLQTPAIPFFTKLRRAYNLLENHVTWAVWAVVITVIAPLPILLGGAFFAQIPIGYNLPRITGLLFNFTLGASIVWILLSRTILPPRPKDVSWIKSTAMVFEWVMVPFIVLVLGSTPALDAQTRLMFGRYMQFNPTEKQRKK